MAAAGPENPLKTTPSGDRRKLFTAVVIVVVSLAALAYSIRRSSAPTSGELLYLSPTVNLAPPPKVTADDKDSTAAALREVQTQAAIVQRDPKNGQALLDLASKAIHAGDPLTVMSSLKAAIALGGEVDATMLDSLGQAQIDLGLCDDAVATYHKLISRFPMDITGFLGEAHAYSSMNRRSDALAALKKGEDALANDDSGGWLALSNEYDMRHDTERALAIAQKAIVASHGKSEAQLADANLLLKLGRIGQAETTVMEVLKAQPGSAIAHRLMGQILIHPRREVRGPKIAEHHFLTALQTNPKDSISLEGLGQICMEQKRYREAAFAYGNMIEAAPDAAPARIQVALAYEKLGDPKTAAEQRAVAAKLVTWRDKEIPLATARDRNRTDATARLNLARFYMESGKYSKALAEIEAAELTPNGKEAARALNMTFFNELHVPYKP